MLGMAHQLDGRMHTVHIAMPALGSLEISSMRVNVFLFKSLFF